MIRYSLFPRKEEIKKALKGIILPALPCSKCKKITNNWTLFQINSWQCICCCKDCSFKVLKIIKVIPDYLKALGLKDTPIEKEKEKDPQLDLFK